MEVKEKAEYIIEKAYDFLDKMGSMKNGKYFVHKDNFGLSSLPKQDLFLLLSILVSFQECSKDAKNALNNYTALLAMALDRKCGSGDFKEFIEKTMEKTVSTKMDLKEVEELTPGEKQIIDKIRKNWSEK